jgi:hypothetical protein
MMKPWKCWLAADALREVRKRDRRKEVRRRIRIAEIGTVIDTADSAHQLGCWHPNGCILKCVLGDIHYQKDILLMIVCCSNWAEVSMAHVALPDATMVVVDAHSGILVHEGSFDSVTHFFCRRLLRINVIYTLATCP